MTNGLRQPTERTLNSAPSKPRACRCEVSWCVGPDLPGDVCVHCLQMWCDEVEK